MLPVDKSVDIKAAVLGIRDASSICLVALVLILYDHILTFNVELESFWTLGLTWIRGLFFLNRYLSILLAACAALNAFILYGTVVIITFSSIVQFTRVYILYKPQRLVSYALMAAMLILWGCFLGFTIAQERSLIYSNKTVPALGSGCIGCRPSGTIDGGGMSWRIFVPLLIQQTILAGMILFKGFTTPAKGEHAKSIMGVVMRDGAIVYISILISIIICFTIRSLGIQLSLTSVLLPVFSICTTRLLVNLRSSPHSQKHNDLFAGVEMTGLYLGGYLGGIAPARGVEGAIVTEIGNTTIIEVPVVDLVDTRGQSRCGDRSGTVEEGGETGRAHSDGHTSVMTTSPPLKVSALGATPGWERWDHRLPTKDFKLPSSPPQECGLHLEGSEEEGQSTFDREVYVSRRVQQHQVQVVERGSTRNGTASRRSQHRTRDRGGSARSYSTIVSMAATISNFTPPSSDPVFAEVERPGTTGTQRTLVHKGSYYAGRPSDDGKGGTPPKPPL